MHLRIPWKVVFIVVFTTTWWCNDAKQSLSYFSKSIHWILNWFVHLKPFMILVYFCCFYLSELCWNFNQIQWKFVLHFQKNNILLLLFAFHLDPEIVSETLLQHKATFNCTRTKKQQQKCDDWVKDLEAGAWALNSRTSPTPVGSSCHYKPTVFKNSRTWKCSEPGFTGSNLCCDQTPSHY